MSNLFGAAPLAMPVPRDAFRDHLLVRSYEVGKSGVIGLGTALRYCESLATDASAAIGFPRSWYVAHNTAWVVREMTILLGALPQIGEELQLATWVSEFRRVQAQREYAIWQSTTGRMVARASARWAYCDTAKGQLTRISDEIAEAMTPFGFTLAIRRPRTLADSKADPERSNGGFSTLQLTARQYEADSQQHINNCVYADWLDEAFSQAITATVSSPDLLYSEQAEISRPRFYYIEYIREVVAGDALHIETRIAPRGRRMIAAEHSIRHSATGVTAVRAYSEHMRQRR